MIATLPHRGTDNYGSGEFGASRDGGARTHNGIDYACYPGTTLFAPVSGKVTKIGFPYAQGVGSPGDPSLNYRYVQITDADDLDHRVFYCSPAVQVGDQVEAHVTKIGTSQDLSKRYPNGMTGHVHYEIRRGHEYLNPEGFN